MKFSRLTEEQMIAILREREAGAKTGGRHGVGQAMFFAQRKKFGGMAPSDAKRLQALEDNDLCPHRLRIEEGREIVIGAI